MASKSIPDVGFPLEGSARQLVEAGRGRRTVGSGCDGFYADA